jgi:hypothetical protein
VPTYSLVASSDCRQTSTALRPTWEYLSQFGKTEDSQASDAEAIAPEARYLGMARGDHWAIAIPFEAAPDPLLQALVNRNHFPRFSGTSLPTCRAAAHKSRIPKNFRAAANSAWAFRSSGCKT